MNDDYEYLNDINTVDNLVDYELDGGDDVKFSIECIVDEFPSRLLAILQSKSNEPSEHDLMIIDVTRNALNRMNNYTKREDCLTSILEVYKNRKKIQ